jgi:hypothetical protein
LLYGRYDASIPLSPDSNSVLPPASVSTRNWRGGSLSAIYSDWLHLRAAYFRTELTTANALVDPLLGPLDSLDLNAAYHELAFVDKRTDFGEVGAEIDYGNWQLISELTETKTHSYYGDQTDSYIALGRHFGRLMAIITWGHVNLSTSATALNYIPYTAGSGPCAAASGAMYPAGTSFPVSIATEFNEQAQQQCGFSAFNPAAPGSPYATSKVPIPVAPLIQGVVAGNTDHDNYFQYDLRYDLANNVALKLDFTTYSPNKKESSFGKVSTNLLSAGVAFSF